MSACTDRDEIIAYTTEHFGVRQAARIVDHFEAALSRIASVPGVGRLDPELDPPGRTFLHLTVLRTWIIVYEVRDDSIHVARILHGARTRAGALAADEPYRGDDEDLRMGAPAHEPMRGPTRLPSTVHYHAAPDT